MQQYMQYRRFSKRLRWKITDYYENRYQGKMFDEKHVLEELNPLLRRTIVNHNCRELVLTVPFFSDTNNQILEEIMYSLSLVMITIYKFSIHE